MVKNRIVRFRISEYQYNKIRENATSKGYFKLSDYVRFKTIKEDVLYTEKIIENNTILHKIMQKTCPNQYRKLFSGRHSKRSLSSDNPVY